MRTLILPLSILLLFASCKKNSQEHSLTGTVLHAVTKQPLTNQIISFTITKTTLGKKDPEFPDGIPIYSYFTYQATTDQTGRYSVNFAIEGTWKYSVDIITPEYIRTWPKWLGIIPTTGNPANPLFTWQFDDTLYAEKAGYVRLHIKNINEGYVNDSVAVRINRESLKWKKYPSIFFAPWPEYTGYQWGFTGLSIDKIVEEKVAAESEPLIPVRWFYKRTDTVVSRLEDIPVAPGVTTDYNIFY